MERNIQMGMTVVLMHDGADASIGIDHLAILEDQAVAVGHAQRGDPPIVGPHGRGDQFLMDGQVERRLIRAEGAADGGTGRRGQAEDQSA